MLLGQSSRRCLNTKPIGIAVSLQKLIRSMFSINFASYADIEIASLNLAAKKMAMCKTGAIHDRDVNTAVNF